MSEQETVVLEQLTEEEEALWWILSDPSGLDQAEFLMVDDKQPDGCYRAWPFQWPWYRENSQYTIEAGARSIGKSMSIILRCLAFPLIHPGQDMLVVAPLQMHLDAILKKVAAVYRRNRFFDSLLVHGRMSGITKKPWLFTFQQGGHIEGRIPHEDGENTKGAHPLWLEQDESQDFTDEAWIELFSTIEGAVEGSQWRCVAEGQHVLTKTGWKLIEQVQVGDEVWTHKNRWRPVVNVWDNGYQECVKINGNGHHGIITTPNHHFYLRSRNTKGRFSEPELTPISSVESERMYWASPAKVGNNNGKVPPMVRLKRERNWVKDTSDPAWLWLYGLYLAEGYCSNYYAANRQHRRVSWCVNDSECDYVAEQLRSLGFKPYFYRQGDHSVKVVVNGAPLQRWLEENAGKLAHNKFIAPWVFDLPEEQRQIIFDGMNYGDGSWSANRRRWEYNTASIKLALGIKLLGQSLGYVSNLSKKPAVPSVIEGRAVERKEHYIVQMTRFEDFENPYTFFFDDMAVAPLRTLEDAGVRHVYDLEVEEDHTYVLEGMVVSNSHGVTKGVRGKFHEFTTSPDSIFKVHHLPALYRPTLTPEEKHQEIMKYGGSKDDQDFRRNFYGLPGDSSSPIFTLVSLMGCVDQDQTSDYNTIEYYKETITEPLLLEVDRNIDHFMNFPASHLSHKTIWMGMDVGFVNDPSVITAFAQETIKGQPHLTLLSKVILKAIPAPDQAAFIMKAIDFYRPKAFAMDANGEGLPVYHIIQRMVEENEDLKYLINYIKPYNFSEKIPVDFDENIEIDHTDPEGYMKAAIMRYTKDWGTDVLRLLMDERRLHLPYDRDLIGEFQGQTVSVAKGGMDAYGRRRVYSKGNDHVLDSSRFAALAFQQQFIDEIIANHKKAAEFQPQETIFIYDDDLW